MATMNISLTDQMKQWVEAQVATGRYAGASEVVRELIRREQTRQDKIAALQEKVIEGIESGFVAYSPEEMKARLKAKAAEHFGHGD